MSAFSSLLSWLKTVWQRVLNMNITSSAFWTKYIQPYWRYTAAFSVGFAATSIFVWNYAKRLNNATSLQLAVQIHGQLSVKALGKDPWRVQHIWKTYFPKAATQPSLKLMSFYMLFRSMKFGSFDQCPSHKNKYQWFVQLHRDNDLMISLQPALPSFVEQQATKIKVNEHVTLHRLSYYKELALSTESKVIYHIHGGSFIGGEPAMFYSMLYDISQQTGMMCFTLQYRVCPENGVTVIEQVDDCLAGYHYLVNTLHIQACNICVMAESSGASLVLLLLQRVKQMANMEQPKCAVLQSPCTDLSYSLPSIESNKAYDSIEAFVEFPNPCLNMAVGYVDAFGQRIANNEDADGVDRKKDARYSPLYADWKGLCDLFFIAAEHEMLCDDSKYAVEKAVAAGVNVEHYWCPFGMHCPAAIGSICDEGKDNLARIVHYLRRKMNG